MVNIPLLCRDTRPMFGVGGGSSLPSVVPDFFVSPTGGTGTGSITDPWSLDYALAGGGGAILPGDIVALRGGTYVGFFTVTNLTGTVLAHIVFQNYPGERAIIDEAIEVETSCSYVDFRSGTTGWLEIANSSPVGSDRIGFFQLGSNIRLINVCVHDCGQSGIFGSAQGTGGEYAGNISYNNGFNNNLDHGIYAQNTTGTKLITDNVFFNNYAFGLHLYGSIANILLGFDIRGNTSFMNGSISGNLHPQLLMGGGTDARNIIVQSNSLYQGTDETSGNCWLGFESAGANHDIDCEDNWIAGGFPSVRYWRWLTNPSVFNNNRVYGTGQVLDAYGPLTTATWTSNTYYRSGSASAWVFNGTAQTLANWRTASGQGASDTATGGAPTTNWVRVRPNAYEVGRAHVTIYNWEGLSSVAVDLSTVLSSGDPYCIYNVENLFGASLTTGVYAGGTVNFPMSAVAPPVPRGSGRTTPSATGPTFQTFLVRRTGTSWYVSTTGSSGNAGTIDSPWSLAHAFSGAGGLIHPGDTIWLRGGEYGTASTAWDISVAGILGNLVMVRNYPHEIAVLNGNVSVSGQYVRVWGSGLGFVVYNSLPSARLVNGLAAATRGVEFINVIVHDSCKSGIAHQTAGPDGQVYGCIVYNCGHEFNLDHGIYFQHVGGTIRKLIRENVIFQNLTYNYHGFGAVGSMSPVDLVGNVGFSWGEITAAASGGEIIVDQDNNDDTTFSRCYTYDINGGEANLAMQFGGNGTANRRFRCEDSILYGGLAVRQTCDPAQLIIARNRFYAMRTFQWWLNGLTTTPPSSWDNNQYGERGVGWGSIERNAGSSPISFADFASWQTQFSAVTTPPTTPDTGVSSSYFQSATGEPALGTFTDVRPNAFEVGRGHVIIYNWADAASISVDLSPILSIGDVYEVRNVQSLWTTPSSHISSTPIASGTYSGGTVSLSMTVTPLNPLDMTNRSLQSPRAVGPRFGTFLVLKMN